MSLFEDVSTKCPACGVEATYEMVHSVNVDRRPELRDEILDSAFQVLTCESCGENFRMEPQFTYIHMAGKQYLSVWPVSSIGNWVAMEQRGDKSFQTFYGPGTSEAAQQIGAEMVRRTVFGWAALREKIVATELGIDDVTLELAKVSILRWADGMAEEGDTELRLLGVDGEDMMVFGSFEPGAEQASSRLLAPRDLLAEIAADADGWQALRERLTEGSFVDALRLQMRTDPV
jgi:hypothetical protein